MKNFRQKLNKNLIERVRGVRVEELLQILLVATVVLIIATVIDPKLLNPLWGKGNPPLYAYFDIFIRFGVFGPVLFTLISVFVVWIVKLVIKNNFNFRRGLLSFIAGIFVLGVLFAVIPGPVYGNPFDVPEFLFNPLNVTNDELEYEQFKEINTTDHEFCSDRIDLFYSPGSSCSSEVIEPALETIKNELEAKGSDVKVYMWCAGKDEESCEEYKSGVYTREYVKNLSDEYRVKTLPTVVVGCKYNMRGVFTLEEYKQTICEKLNECGL